jgi:hypothetical protein
LHRDSRIPTRLPVNAGYNERLNRETGMLVIDQAFLRYALMSNIPRAGVGLYVQILQCSKFLELITVSISGLRASSGGYTA